MNIIYIVMIDFVEHANYTMRWISDNFPPIEDHQHFYNLKDKYDDETDDFYNVDRDYDMLEYLYGNNNTSHTSYNDHSSHTSYNDHSSHTSYNDNSSHTSYNDHSSYNDNSSYNDHSSYTSYTSYNDHTSYNEPSSASEDDEHYDDYY